MANKQFNSMKDGIDNMVKESTKRPYAKKQGPARPEKFVPGKNNTVMDKLYGKKVWNNLLEKKPVTPQNYKKETKKDVSKSNKSDIISNIGNTMADSIPNPKGKDNSMPVPRRN